VSGQWAASSAASPRRQSRNGHMPRKHVDWDEGCYQCNPTWSNIGRLCVKHNKRVPGEVGYRKER
jgi:hypothetical protein